MRRGSDGSVVSVSYDLDGAKKMLSFATEFPVDNSYQVSDFIESFKFWILGSPYANIDESDFTEMPQEGEWSFQKGNHRIDALLSSFGSEESVAIQYIIQDGDLEWNTTIVFSRRSSDTWIGVRTSCQSRHPSTVVPTAKKPIIIKTLLNNLGAANDGEFQVKQSPHILSNDDIALAARAISGQSGCHLPIVYVSLGFSGKYIVDPGALAQKLAGMAHVLIEPNRPFSHRLQIEVKGENVYGGTVGIYWSDGSRIGSSFTEKDNRDKIILMHRIFDEIRSALLNKRPQFRCTWPSTQGIYYKSALSNLKNSGSEEVDKYVEAFDGEINSKNEQIINCEKEIYRLQNEIKKYQHQGSISSGVFIHTKSEQDLYDGEIKDAILNSIADYLVNCLPHSRRSHILNDIIESNKIASSSKREEIKEILRDYKEMNKSKKENLESMGFTIEDGGKHYKLTYHDDTRYIFSLSKTASDYRSGLNLASDISKKIF